MLRMKYSSAMLRPPATTIALSAMNSLLCMRWLSRPKSESDAAYLESRPPRPQQNGLNRRTSTFGNAASPMNSSIAADRVQIVDDQPHPHAAHCGVAQVAQQQVPGLVVVDLVVLDVERVRRPLGELDARVERIRRRAASAGIPTGPAPGVDAWRSATSGLRAVGGSADEC